jgi:serine/threonine-protein kinase
MIGQCSIPLLEAALVGSLPANEEATLCHHLEECEACGAAMEQMAGGVVLCREAASLLIGDELDEAVPAQGDWSDVDFTVEHLEPSDEPNVLGRLGGYDVLEIIGRGGMGIVLKGFDRELKRCVAIKVLAPHLAHSSLAKKRFAREAQAAAAVVHPHVLAIHHVQPGGRLPFLVMPLVAGESLAERLAAQGTLELKEILRMGMQAAAGLGAAHDQGLVHRDVKPANILLERGVERAVLTDFGLARAADDVSMTRWGIIAGTPQYMSPEQAKGEPLDGRSDLFSLGCVLYEMATGVSPFHSDGVLATMRRLVDESPQALASLNPELPPWFVAVVDRLLEKDPSRRFSSAREVSELLEGCLAHLQQPANVPLPAGLPQPARRRAWRPSNIGFKGVLAMIGALAIGLGGVILLIAQNQPVENFTKALPPEAVAKLIAPARGINEEPLGGDQILGGDDLRGKWAGEKNGIKVDLTFRGEQAHWQVHFRKAITPEDPRQLPSVGVTIGADLKGVVDVKALRLNLHLPAYLGDDKEVQRSSRNGIQPVGQIQRGPEGTMQLRIIPTGYENLALHDYDYPAVEGLVLRRVAESPKQVQPKLVHRFPAGTSVNTIAFSADGKLIAIANGNPTFIMQMNGTSLVKDNWRPSAEILNAGTGKTVVSLKLASNDEYAVSAAPDRASHFEVKALALWPDWSGVAVGALAATQQVSHFEVRALAFSPDANLVAVGTSIGQVKLFNARTGELVRSLDDERAKLADKNTPENWKSLKRALGSVASLAFSPDGSLLAVCGESFDDFSRVIDGARRLGRLTTGPGRLKVWDVKTGTLKLDLVGHSHANAVAFSLDGNLLASAGNWLDNNRAGTGVIVWDPRNGKKIRTMTTEANGGTHAVAFSPNSKLVLIGSRIFDKDNDTSTTAISLAHALTGIMEWKQIIPGWANPKAFSPDGKSVAVLCGKQSIRIFETETGTLKHEIRSAASPQGGRWNDFAIAPQGHLLAIGGSGADNGGFVEVWELDSAPGGRGND